MKRKVLSISSLLLITSFAQCEVETPLQKEKYADFLQWKELRKQFNNSPEGQDFNNASAEFYASDINLMTIEAECSRLGICETSNDLIEAFLAAIKAKNNFMQQAEKIKQLEVCKIAAELEKKYQ